MEIISIGNDFRHGSDFLRDNSQSCKTCIQYHNERQKVRNSKISDIIGYQNDCQFIKQFKAAVKTIPA